MKAPIRLNKKVLMILLLACVAAACIFFVGFLTGSKPGGSNAAQQTQSSGSASVNAQPAPAYSLSVWVAYWDWENGLKDLNIANVDSVQVFAASFNKSDKLFFPDEMATLAAKIKPVESAHPDMRVYLSLVNDAQDAEGNWTDKDSGVVDRLMQSDTTRQGHVSEILNLVNQSNYNGVEIDYEKISGSAWSGFTVFCSQLYDTLKANGKALRVVLEPGSPLTAGNLPAGPEYVMMAYNLYGQGTEPGPRANDAFIRKLAVKMKALPGDNCFAFATGGYDWAGGEAKELTESDAYNLSQKSQDLERDGQSGALHFTYQVNGAVHTVWYADGQTLKHWIDLSRLLGIGNVAVWKMGGDMPETLQMLSGLKQAG